MGTLTAFERHHRAVVAQIKNAPEWAACEEALAEYRNQHIVYFAQHGGPDGLIKIGYTGNLEARILDLQAQSPFEIVALGWCEGGKREERRLHRTYVTIRSHGEWFLPTPELLDYIADNARQGPHPPKPPYPSAAVEARSQMATRMWEHYGRTPA